MYRKCQIQKNIGKYLKKFMRKFGKIKNRFKFKGKNGQKLGQIGAINSFPLDFNFK